MPNCAIYAHAWPNMRYSDHMVTPAKAHQVSASPVHQVKTVCWSREAGPAGIRQVAEETAIALTYDGTTQAVMMATPQDLEDYAVGFSLTEGQIERPDQIRSIDIVRFDEGIDIRLWLDDKAAARFRDRRRHIVGPTGCGLCGIESLAEALPAPQIVNGEARFDALAIQAAQQALFARQDLHAETRAVHAAGLWNARDGLVAVREDVGRHNALDKLVGALSREGRAGGASLLLLTSRVSVEMVQKAAVLGSPVIVAVSAPTGLAVRVAEQCGITIVALARQDSFEVFTHPRRILGSNARPLAR